MKPTTISAPLPAVAALLALVLLAAGCGGEDAQPTASTAVSEKQATSDAGSETEGPPPPDLSFDDSASVVIPNSPGTLTTTGRQRVMTAVLSTESSRFLGGPDLPVTIGFEAVDSDDSGHAEGKWLMTSEAALGLYVSYFEFPSAGLWEISVSADGSEVAKTVFEVTEESSVPNIGDPVPPTQSLTGANAQEIAVISTDQDPNPDFYDLSIADAVSNGRPTVIAFVTPAFCQTALCGPTLETVKLATAGRDDIDVVHVEPYNLTQAPQGLLQPIAAMDEWGLQTEPWVFVIGADGIVIAIFEGILGLEEMRSALDTL